MDLLFVELSTLPHACVFVPLCEQAWLDDIVTGDETWTSLIAKSIAQQWTVVQGLESGVTYEVKVIASDDDAYCPETQSSVRRVQIDVKRGFYSY